jgi:hypothetical protein
MNPGLLLLSCGTDLGVQREHLRFATVSTHLLATYSKLETGIPGRLPPPSPQPWQAGLLLSAMRFDP